jgi:hypothetical protein
LIRTLAWEKALMARRTTFAKAAVSVSVLVVSVLGEAFGQARLEYNRDIRPILSENCFACHGADKNARKAGLRLDQRADALDSGAIVPGDPDKSPLIERIFAEDAKERMPPAKSKRKLTADQKEVLKRWIAAGAEYQPHWSFITPKRPGPPPVKNVAWVRNPIDNFILSALEKQGLQPAPQADRRTLARRVSLDLTGLPPSPADVEAFVADPSANAYERLVDRLLRSPQWGEHRGRYWLDAARFADTHGIHFDNYREIWTYRDWVIDAFNRNLPFDQFTIEQLAGDLLPNHTLEQRIASGFNRCNITTNEGGVIPEEYLVFYTRDRTETTARIWMGLTANCAVCHDHKFDPLNQREFYSMGAFFNNTTQGAMDGNIKGTPPIITVPRPGDRLRWEAVSRGVEEVRREIQARRQIARKEFDRWVAGVSPTEAAAMVPQQGLCFHAPLSEGEGNAISFVSSGKPGTTTLKGEARWDAGHVAAKAFQTRPESGLSIPSAGDFEKDKAFSFGAWVKLTKRAQFGAVLARMDDRNGGYRGWDLWLENNRVGTHLIHTWKEDALKVLANMPLALGVWSHLFVTYDGSGKAKGVKIYINGQPQETTVEADNLKNSIRTPVALTVGQRYAAGKLDGVSIQDARFYETALSADLVTRLARTTRAAWLLGKSPNDRSAAENAELYDWWLEEMDPPTRLLVANQSSLRAEETAIKSRGTIAHVMQERSDTPKAYVLYRGEYDKRRDPVQPATPKFLPSMPPDYPKDRLGFARWLLRPEQPLTARVTVNRAWQEVFGTGIVRTSDDFGVMGEAPSHPELLDWLAVEFVESGWDMKRFFKLLVTSAAYRQSAVTTPEKLEKDSQNRLLSRGPRFRMDAEMIRDSALAASGLLVRTLGGPSVRPYQPEGVWQAVAMIGSNTRDYVQDHGASLYRRSLYTFWKRSAPPASMEIFNAPTREVCSVRRERTDTPLQALVTLNDPQFVEAARTLAQATLQAGSDQADERIDLVARRLLARPLRSEEKTIVEQSLSALLGYYRSHVDDARALLRVGESKADPTLDAATLAAWTMLTNELMNLDEFLNK